jgi:hypothetical protein
MAHFLINSGQGVKQSLHSASHERSEGQLLVGSGSA